MASSARSDNTLTRPDWHDDKGRRRFLASLPLQPGVYRMFDDKEQVIYVGKAASLRKRVASYLSRTADLPIKTRALMSHVLRIEVTVTRTENEALILENNLIKSLKPRYNILLRDDKTYPRIRLTASDDFPRLSIYRGRRRPGERYFGPYPAAGIVRETVDVIQKLFRLRTCEDSFFRNRSRPCLQYQIQRCTAPCVGLIPVAEYRRDVEHAVLFIEGREQLVTDDLSARMDQAAERLDFEAAARYRDQIAALRRFQEKQFITSAGQANVDVVACAVEQTAACVEVFHIRGGRNLGSRTYYPRLPVASTESEILTAFLPRFYLGRELPDEIIVAAPKAEASLLEATLREQTGKAVRLITRPRSERAQWLRLAEVNAGQNLVRRQGRNERLEERFAALQQALELNEPAERIECFDISHTSGEATVASCVVFASDGPVKADYRRFNIRGIVAGDDYAAMRQALLRRFRHADEERGKWPDLLLIDGGKGQVSQALDVYEELGLEVGRNGPEIIGVAKGPERIAGQEWLYRASRDEVFHLPADSPALHLIQAVRDEAHRFAISGHRNRRGKARKTSTLEQIPGIGPNRRRQLLRHFGGLQGVQRAAVEDLQAIDGISQQLAQRIFAAFHAHDD